MILEKIEIKFLSEPILKLFLEISANQNIWFLLSVYYIDFFISDCLIL